jgi:hypothetical protein
LFDDGTVLSSAEQIEKFSVLREQNEKFPMGSWTPVGGMFSRAL